MLHRYTEAINGIAVQLTRAQAQKVARIDVIADPARLRELEIAVL